ncbi:MAG: LCP family protein [Thermoleophilaceae bacterium]
MSDSGRDDRPDYKVYRARRGPLGRGGSSAGLDALRKRVRGEDPPDPRTDHKQRRTPGKVTPGRVGKWIAVAVFAWIVLSLVVFFASAQLQKGVSDSTDQALTGGGSLITGGNVLVLGSDSRAGESLDKTQAGPGRADSILVLHASLGSVRKLSIPRDSYAQIPGHGAQKINAAYGLGGAGLMVNTVESFLGNGLKINHVVEVDFQDFPELIDSLGGVTVDNKSRICSPEFDNFYRGFNLSKGKHKLDGRKALGFARVRKNPCAPNENDLARAVRQQEVVSGIRGKLLSPASFIRLPLISWQAPRTIQTDMAGPGLMGLFSDLITGNSDTSTVLKPSCLGCGPGSSLLVADGEKRSAVQALLKGN